MNSSRCSSLLVVLVTLLLAVGLAGAVSVSEDAPSEAKVGTDVTASFELTDLYTDYNQWTLRGETGLTNVTWTITVYNQANEKLPQGATYDGQSFGHGVDINSGTARVAVSLTGTVPNVANFTYEPEETFVVARLTQTRQNGSSNRLAAVEAHHYTDNSRTARAAIDDAQAAIDAAGGHQEAEGTLQGAISAYENENFQNAVNLASQAEETASSAKASQGRTRLILMGVGALALVGVVIGGVIYWRNSRTHSRL